MKIHNIFVAITALLPLAAAAQNLDPTVEVSRTYEGKLMEVHKPRLEMAVPDSVLHFDLDFDYSVTDTPYKGAYEFSPYTVEMKPSATLRDFNSFYLKTGAGYQLHPVFDLVWSPMLKGDFRMNIRASHNSFVGNYWTLDNMPSLSDGEMVLRRMPKKYDERDWRGYDLDNRAGVDGRYDWEGGLLEFDVAFNNIEQKDNYQVKRSYNGVQAVLGAASKNAGGGFLWKADAMYRYAEDMVRRGEGSFLRENDFSVTAGFGYGLANGDLAMLDLGFDHAATSGILASGGGGLDIVPHYVMSPGRWRFDLGVRISAAFRTDSFTEMYDYHGQIIYPDVRIEYKVLPDNLMFYMDFGGDSHVDSYSDLLKFNRRADMHYTYGGHRLLDVSEERLRAAVGVEGRVGPRFSYEVSGGYVNYGNSLLDMVGRYESTSVLMPGLCRHSYQQAFAEAGWLFESESFRFDGNVVYAYSWDNEIARDPGIFLPAELTGDLSFEYNWKKRLFFGVECVFSTDRKGSFNYPVEGGRLELVKSRIPGYADLGLMAEYGINRTVSVWARGGNLLGMTIQRSLLYAEKGPYFTAGICLNL